MAVIGFVGWLGSGKSLSMVSAAVEDLRRDFRPIYTNMRHAIFPGSVYIPSFAALEDVYDGIVLIDEAGLWMPSRDWQKLPREMLYKFTQMRKCGIDVYWTAPHEARVDAVLREITQVIVRCRRLPAGMTFQLYSDPDAKITLKRRLLPFNPNIANLYDTMEIIGNPLTGEGMFRKRSQGNATHRAIARRGAYLVSRPSNNEFLYGAPPLTPDQIEIAEYLVRKNLYPSIDRVPRAEITWHVSRKFWLRQFRLSLSDVPLDCSPANPWLVPPPSNDN